MAYTKDRRAANELTGTLYDTDFNQPDKPVQLGTITIAGTILHIAVYPKRATLKGTLVNDVRLHYPTHENGRLVRVNND